MVDNIQLRSVASLSILSHYNVWSDVMNLLVRCKLIVILYIHGSSLLLCKLARFGFKLIELSQNCWMIYSMEKSRRLLLSWNVMKRNILEGSLSTQPWNFHPAKEKSNHQMYHSDKDEDFVILSYFYSTWMLLIV